MPHDIQTVGFDADQKLLDYVEKKVEKLESIWDRITDIKVYLKLEEKSSHIKDKTAEVKINVPGSTLFAKESSKKFEEALDSAANSVKQQVRKYKDKLESKY